MATILMDQANVLAFVSRLSSFLQSQGVDLPCPSDGAQPGAELLGRLPPWIARYGAVMEGKNAWICIEPHAKSCVELQRQVLIYLPSGRYLVDTFDTVHYTCVARESAAGNPLVVGLVRGGGPILLWIRPMSRFEEP